MNYRMIARLLAIILQIVAALMIPALAISLVLGETNSAWGFAITLITMLALSLLPRLVKPRSQAMYAREGFVVVSLAWILVSLLGALPFYISRSIPSYVDCLFETVSGFTTTGASILTDVESLPRGLVYWRSFTHWIGGMGVLVFLLAISPLSAESIFIMRAESPGPQVSKLVPRTRQSARILYEIYIAMTIVQIVFLLAGGMSAFDAVTITFGTAGTGGFAIRNDSMMSYSPYIQWVVTIFMALFGVNFGLYYLLLLRSYRKIVRNEELRLYIGTLVASTAVISLFIANSYEGAQNAIRHAAFQVASIMTTTGYATTDFDKWPEFCRGLLIVLMIIGASAGSTGGGIKCSRVIILFKSMKQEMKKILHPNTVTAIRVDGELLMPETIRQVYVFLGLYACISIFSIMLISLDGYSMETNLSAVMACINNIGPGLSMVGPMGNFSQFSNASKIVLTLNMLLGRLEIFPLVILASPGIWKRAR